MKWFATLIAGAVMGSGLTYLAMSQGENNTQAPPTQGLFHENQEQPSISQAYKGYIHESAQTVARTLGREEFRNMIVPWGKFPSDSIRHRFVGGKFSITSTEGFENERSRINYNGSNVFESSRRYSDNLVSVSNYDPMGNWESELAGLSVQAQEIRRAQVEFGPFPRELGLSFVSY